MPNPLEPGFNPGGYPDKVDTRDFQWAEIGAALPPFDWSKGYDVETVLSSALNVPDFKLPVKNQDGSGSCGGQAWGQYQGVLEAVASGTFEERSAKYIYAQTWVPPSGGTFGRDNCNVCIKQGVARESLLTSYEAGNPPGEAFMRRSEDITQAARDNAKSDKSLSYANVDLDIDLFAQAIQQNYGMILGIYGSNNGSWGTAFPNPPTPSETKWGHWVYAGKAKLINGKKFIGFLNSWGPQIGDKGWQFIGEDYFAGSFFNNGNGWTMMFNNQSLERFYHTFLVPIRMGSKGNEVLALQKALRIDGEFTYPTNTGFYGDFTRAAVLAFQQKHSIPTDGLNGTLVGPKTRAYLNSLFSQ